MESKTTAGVFRPFLLSILFILLNLKKLFRAKLAKNAKENQPVIEPLTLTLQVDLTVASSL